MVSTRRKGNRAELKAERELQQEGWLVYRVRGSTKFNRNVDIFGLFDLLCLFPPLQNHPQRRKWIQVKSNTPVYGKELKPFRDFRKDYCDENDSVEIWTWIDRKSWKKKIIGE